MAKIKLTIGVWPTQPFGPRPPLGGKKYFKRNSQ